MLNLLGCLDKPIQWQSVVGRRRHRLDERTISWPKSAVERIGFVFQSYNLIQQLSVVENIQVPLYYQGRLGANERKSGRDVNWPNESGLAERLDHRPQSTLRAVNSNGWRLPAVWSTILFSSLADEPTGNLDSITTDEILEIFDALNSRRPHDHPGHSRGSCGRAWQSGLCG